MQQNTSLYDSLNVTAAASTSEIKKAYRNAALKYHPDKNNHTEESKRKFQEICQAYEILKDNRLRALYDQYGTTDEVLIQEQQAQAQRQQAGPFSSSSNFDTEAMSFPDLSPGDLFAQFLIVLLPPLLMAPKAVLILASIIALRRVSPLLMAVA